MRILLDTTVLIDATRGGDAATRIRALPKRYEPPYICAVNVEEMWRGARDDEHGAIERFLSGFRVAPLGRKEGRLAGGWRRRYATEGLTLSQSDCLIAAAAHGVGAVLATGNVRQFPMPELHLEDWLAEPEPRGLSAGSGAELEA